MRDIETIDTGGVRDIFSADEGFGISGSTEG